jgi:hypothetical protein
MIAGQNEEKIHPRKATMKFFIVAIILAIIPKLVLDIVASSAPAMVSNLDLGDANSIFAIGCIIAVLVAMEAFFPKVSQLKMIFGVSVAIVSIMYLWSLLGKGTFNFQIGGAFMHIDITLLSILILCSLLLSCFIPISRYSSARKELAHSVGGSYLEQYELPEDDQEDGYLITSGIVSQFLDAPDPPPPDIVPSPICRSFVNAYGKDGASSFSASISNKRSYGSH